LIRIRKKLVIDKYAAASVARLFLER